MSSGILRAFADASDIVGGGASGLDNSGMAVEDLVANIIRVVLWVMGVLAVGFIIYGGVRYVMSQGDSSKIASAKNTIMYAVIGLIVAILAYAIVGFVVDGIRGAGGEEKTDESSQDGGGGREA